MENIKIDLTKLEKEVSKMKHLLSEFQSEKTDNFEAEGMGKTKKRIKITTDYFDTLDKALEKLMKATIHLLEQEKQRYAGIDDLAASKVGEMDKR